MQQLKNINDYTGYGQFLTVLAQFVWPVENAIAAQPVQSLIPDVAQRRRGLALTSDLLSLGLSQPENVHEPVSFITNEFEACGALYVLEGSALGGAIIGKQILPSKGISKHLNYFLSGIENVHASWNKFKQELDERVPESRYEEVLAGASNTFEAFRIWLLKFDKQYAVND